MRRLATPALLGLSITMGLSCSGQDGGTDPDDGVIQGFDRKDLLESVGRGVILPTYRTLEARTAELESSASAYADAIESGAADTATRAAALEDAYHAAMTAAQRAEVLQVGPAASSLTAMGGRDLRDVLYSWPTTNPCRVDQVLVEERYAEASFFDDELVNVYGLDALEYLIFAEGTDNACPPQLEINQGPWEALGADEIRRRRAAYAARVAAHAHEVAEELVTIWDGQGFAQTFAAGESPFGGPREAVDALFHAIYYIELEVKDMKLALPTGLSPRCSTDTCPEDLESRFADRSKENVIANLQAFRDVFRGNLEGEAEGVGFDDFLTALDAGDLAEQMDSRAAAAIEAAQAVDGSFRAALATDPEAVRAVHAAVKSVTDLLKSQFVTVLNLSVPQEGAADND